MVISGFDSSRFDSDTAYEFKVFYRLYSPAVVGDAELAAAPSDSERAAESGVGGLLGDAPGEAELAVRDGEDGPAPEAPDAWGSCTSGG